MDMKNLRSKNRSLSIGQKLAENSQIHSMWISFFFKISIHVFVVCSHTTDTAKCIRKLFLSLYIVTSIV